MSKTSKWIPLGAIVLGLGFVSPSVACTADDEIPITTSSEEARELFVQGRDLGENIRNTEAREYYLRAIEKDPNFALAHWALANTAQTTAEFFASLEKAVEASKSVSPGERSLILAQNAAVHDKQEEQARHLRALLDAHPKDARAQGAMGGYHYRRQEYDKAVEHYKLATTLSPEFAPAYNMLGYACRMLQDRNQAERAFQRYIELVPNEPNPYDSYAEFLMEAGRFEESITHYRKALEKNSNFTASYVGIGNNQMFMNDLDEARTTFASLRKIARNSREEREAVHWTAASFVHEGKPDEALKAVKSMLEIAAKSKDQAAQSGDHVLMGNILLETGSPDEALAHYERAVEIMNAADVPAERKEAVRRNHVYFKSRVAIAQDDLDVAKQEATKYGELIASGIPFETRRHCELLGTIAMASGDVTQALKQLEQANQRNPRILFLLAQAHALNNDDTAARAACERAANFNGLSFDYAFVRSTARKVVGDVGRIKASFKTKR